MTDRVHSKPRHLAYVISQTRACWDRVPDLLDSTEDARRASRTRTVPLIRTSASRRAVALRVSPPRVVPSGSVVPAGHAGDLSLAVTSYVRTAVLRFTEVERELFLCHDAVDA